MIAVRTEIDAYHELKKMAEFFNFNKKAICLVAFMKHTVTKNITF